jgi:hypothetical protein
MKDQKMVELDQQLLVADRALNRAMELMSSVEEKRAIFTVPIQGRQFAGFKLLLVQKPDDQFAIRIERRDNVVEELFSYTDFSHVKMSFDLIVNAFKARGLD